MKKQSFPFLSPKHSKLNLVGGLPLAGWVPQARGREGAPEAEGRPFTVSSPILLPEGFVPNLGRGRGGEGRL